MKNENADAVAMLQGLRCARPGSVRLTTHAPRRFLPNQGDGFARSALADDRILVLSAEHADGYEVRGYGTTAAMALQDFLTRWPDGSDPIVAVAAECAPC